MPLLLNNFLSFICFAFQITGLETNINFLIDLASHPEFQAANVHTGFIDQHFDTLFPPIEIKDTDLCKAAISLVFNELQASQANCVTNNDPFAASPNLRLNYDLIRQYQLKANDKTYQVNIKYSNDTIEIQIINGVWYNVKADRIKDGDRLKIRSNIANNISNYNATIDESEVTIFLENGKKTFELVQPKFLDAAVDQLGSSGSKVVAPMPGVLEKVLVKPGDHVKKGDSLVVLIAMKMEHILKAPKDAIIKSIGGVEGGNVAKGSAVVTFEDEEEKC